MRRFLKLKALGLLLLVVAATLAVLPSVVPNAQERLPSWITSTFTRTFKLGLDLQGGLHLEYSVGVDEALENKLDGIAAELEASFAEKKDIRPKVERVGTDTLLIRFDEPGQVALATDDVMGPVYGLLERADAPDDGVPSEADGVITLKMPEAVLTETRAQTVGTALETVRKRVDAMGVAEPNIYPKNRQIVVELPGLSDTSTEALAASSQASDRIREVLAAGGAQQVMVSEVRGNPWAFKITLPDSNSRDALNAAFADKMTEALVIVDDRLPFELQILEDDPAVQADVASDVLTLTEAAQESVLEDSSDFRRLLKIIERQAVLTMHLVDDERPFRETGKPYLKALFDAHYVTEGMGISVNVERDYGRDNGVTVKEPYAFFAKDKKTLQNFFAGLPPQWRLPPDRTVYFGPTPIVTRRGEEAEILYRTYILHTRAGVTGDKINNASVQPDPQTGQPQVAVQLNRQGANQMEDLSGNNIGRKMAIVLDDEVRSDPIFNDRLSGNFVITLGASPGKTVREEANDLVKVLKSGSLPARLQKEFEIRVGADLGKESVEQGFLAFVVGLVAVIIFMLFYYRGSGLIAVFALVLNMVLILAAMAFFGATLTLPGIAGVVLTIGMAVDANVIVFERIREYVREGFTARAAIESGYDRAFTTILDAQLTTAIAGLVLYQYGSGPIQGFAVTLMIGIATSIFTGVWCSRLFFDFQSNRRGFDRVSI
ncbi:MAG: protein translocase subunit SecD [Nannocystales bacterium]